MLGIELLWDFEAEAAAGSEVESYEVQSWDV